MEKMQLRKGEGKKKSKRKAGEKISENYNFWGRGRFLVIVLRGASRTKRGGKGGFPRARIFHRLISFFLHLHFWGFRAKS